MAAPRKKSLKVFFDTNVIYTQVASDLFRSEVSEFLAAPIKDPQLEVQWYLPEAVCSEREFQMNARATELLPPLAKLERVLGHQLGINAEVVRDRIASTIRRELEKHRVNVATLDTAKVPWPAVIDAAIKRRPPFQNGEKEKGFRDALIVETFAQEVARSPKTPSICLLAFVSEDVLAREAASMRTAGSTNVRVLEDLDELKSLINTLASEVSEDYVEEMRAKAAPLFWTNNEDKSTLYYTAEVSKQIKEKYPAELQALPEGIVRVKEKMFYVTQVPTFLQKEGTTLEWMTKVRVEQELYRPSKLQELQNAEPSAAAPTATNKLLSGLLALGAAKDELAGTRNLNFYVVWSTRVNTKKQLSAVRFETVFLEPPKADADLNVAA